MKLKVSQVIGLNTDQKAAQVISESRGDQNYFFAVLILESDDAFTKGRQILSDLTDFYFDLEQGSIGEKLTQTFEEAKKRLEIGEYSLLLSSISGKVLYLINIGEVAIYLKRGEKVSPLNFGASSQLVSGFLEENDRLLFSTKTLIDFLGDDLEKSIKLSMDTFEEDISSKIGEGNLENHGLAALLAEIQPETEQGVSPEDNIPALEQEEEQTAFTGYSQDNLNSKLRFNLKNTLRSSLGFLWSKRKYFPKSNRGRLILAGFLIIVLALGVWAQVNSKKSQQTQSEFNQVLQKAKDDLNAAKGLSSLNPAEAKTKLDQAKQEVEKALALKPKDADAQSLKNQIDQDSPSILQKFSVSEFPLFLDLDLVKKNFKASQISMSNGKILLLDQSLKSLVLIDLAKKSNQILAGSEQLGDALLASLNGDLGFVYSKDKGVLKIDTQNKKVTQVAKKDDDWDSIKDIYAFASNVYLLDLDQIWKYLPTTEGYSDKREYLNKTTKANFTDILRMQIESSVYILKSGGEILRFTRGEKDNFSYEGLPSPVNNPKSIFVSSDTDNLYLLDSGNSRLLILTKTGSYKGQVDGEKFSSASDLVVDEKAKKVYLLDGSKIYTVDLK